MSKAMNRVSSLNEKGAQTRSGIDMAVLKQIQLAEKTGIRIGV